MKKKTLKIVLSIFLVLFAIIAVLLSYVKFALPNVGEAPVITVEKSDEKVERGKYLANHVMVCMDCHGKRDWSKFSGPMVAGFEGAGGEVFDQKFGFPGKYVSKNITPFNLGNWTDGEIFRTITCGVNKDNKALFPVMPYKYYSQLDTRDIEAVIAYLRTLPAIDKINDESIPDFPLNFIINTIPEKANLNTRPEESDSIAYGKYVATASGCMECHTKQEKGKMVGPHFAGGFEFNLGNGTRVTSMNITPHKTGIGTWTKEQFVSRFKMYELPKYVPTNVNLANQEFQTVMPWTMYAGMKTTDLEAIYNYLRTVPPMDNTIERFAIINN